MIEIEAGVWAMQYQRNRIKYENNTWYQAHINDEGDDGLWG